MELNWSHFDDWAICASDGVAVIGPALEAACTKWLDRTGYAVRTIDFRSGIKAAMSELDTLLQWKVRFGSELGVHAGLGALADAFQSTPLSNGRFVLKILGAERAWHEDSRFFSGLLFILRTLTRQHLIFDHRFFTLLVLEDAQRVPGESGYDALFSDPRDRVIWSGLSS